MPRFFRIEPSGFPLSRRAWLKGAIGASAAFTFSGPTLAAQTPAFAHWVAEFRARALRRGITAATYDRVMGTLTPDTSVFAQFHAQPEFTEQVWQYINRRCSDWRVITGKERAKEYAGLFARIEKDYGVDRYTMLGLWGMESSFGDVIVNPKYMRPVIPALAALAWGEQRRRSYWEAELLNALTIVDHGWAKPADMIGSWAGAMGHTQWMPEVWLHMGVDYDRDGRVTPYRQAGRFTCRHRALSWSSAANISAAKPGAARSNSAAARRAAGAVTRNGRRLGSSAPTAGPSRGRATG